MLENNAISSLDILVSCALEAPETINFFADLARSPIVQQNSPELSKLVLRRLAKTGRLNQIIVCEMLTDLDLEAWFKFTRTKAALSVCSAGTQFSTPIFKDDLLIR